MKQTYRTPGWLRIGTYLAIGWGIQLAMTATTGYAFWIVLGCVAGAIAVPLLLRAGTDRVLRRERSHAKVATAGGTRTEWRGAASASAQPSRW